VEFRPGRTKSDAESAEKAAADKDATKAEDAQKKTDAKEVSDRETAEFESEETVAKEEGDKKPAQKSADEAAAKVGTESAEKENLSVPIDHKGCQTTEKKEKRKADLIVNQDLSGAKLDVHVKGTYAADLPQVGMKAISQGYEEKLSVPTGTKGYQATDAERKADLVVNKDRSSADEAESAGLYVKDSCAEILPQVEVGAIGVSHKENLSVPIDHKGCQTTDEKAGAQVIVNQDFLRETKNQNTNPSKNQRKKIREKRLANERVAALEMARNNIVQNLEEQAINLVEDAMEGLVDTQTEAPRKRIKVQKPQFPLLSTKRHRKWAAQKLRELDERKVAVHLECVSVRLERAGQQKKKTLTPRILKCLQTLSELKRDRRKRHHVNKDFSNCKRDQQARRRKSTEYRVCLLRWGRSLLQRIDILRRRRFKSACKLANKTCFHLQDMTTEQVNSIIAEQDSQATRRAHRLEVATAAYKVATTQPVPSEAEATVVIEELKKERVIKKAFKKRNNTNPRAKDETTGSHLGHEEFGAREVETQTSIRSAKSINSDVGEQRLKMLSPEKVDKKAFKKRNNTNPRAKNETTGSHLGHEEFGAMEVETQTSMRRED